MRRGLWLTLTLLLALLTLTGLALAQETTPEPVPPTLTETPTVTPTPTDTASPEPVPSPIPTATETPIPTPSPLPTEAASPTPETTVETTAETTAEVTTPTLTLSPTATGTSTETPTVTAALTETATSTPLPPEPELGPVMLGDFDAGYPGEWLLGAGWSWEFVPNEGVLQLLNSPEAAVLQWGDLLNVALSARFQVQSGGLRLSVRQSAAGSYNAVIDSGGLLRLYRGEEELASAFVGVASAGQWRTLRLSAMADGVRVALDGVEVLAVADLSPLPPGAMTLAGAGSSTLWIGAYRVERPLAELQAETQPAAALAFQPLAAQSRSALVFTSSRDGDNEIFILDPAMCDGIVDCPATQLTFNAVADADPALSPDGSTIAFSSLRDGNYELYLMNVDGSDPVRLTYHSASDKDPAWAPDGSRIAFASDRTGHYEIDVIHLDQCGLGADCPAVPLTTSVNRSSEPAWHGSRIAYNSFEVGPSGEIWVMNDDGSGKQQLTNSNSIDSMPTWSPDGNEIAFVSNRYESLGNYDVVKLNYSQCTTQPNCPVIRLTTAAGYDFHPSWSPDGSEIAFTSDPLASAQIHIMNADGTNQVRLTYTRVNRDPQWWGPQCPTEGAMRALSGGGEYCHVPTETPEPPLIPPYDPATECLARLVNWTNNLDRRVFQADEIAEYSNGDLLEDVILGWPQLDERYAVIVAMHLNQQFVQIRYLDDAGQVVAGDQWVRVRNMARNVTFEGLEWVALAEGNSCLDESGQFSDAKVEQLMMAETDLPVCMDSQFVDCRPAIACDWVFGCNADGTHQYEVRVLNRFGSTTGGCDNADDHCEPDPCRSWPYNDDRHCGTDLQTTEADGHETGPVYAVESGYFCDYFPSGSVYSIRLVVGSEIWEYQYTHVGPEITTPVGAHAYSYIASGVFLGNYGKYGNTDRDNLHLHLVNIVYEYEPGSLLCSITTRLMSMDDPPDDPYRPVEIPGVEVE